MKLARRSALVMMLVVSFMPRPSFAADMTIVAQGTGTFNDTTWPGGLKCSVPIVVTFEVSGSSFVLSEADAVASTVTNMDPEAKVECASWFVGTYATNQFPHEHQCESVPMGPTAGFLLDPYTFTGAGSTSPNNPYVVKAAQTGCDGKTTTDKATFYKAAVNGTFAYVHEQLLGTTSTYKLTATLTRMQ